MKIGDVVEWDCGWDKVRGTIIHIYGDVCTISYHLEDEMSCNIKDLTLVRSK